MIEPGLIKMVGPDRAALVDAILHEFGGPEIDPDGNEEAVDVAALRIMRELKAKLGKPCGQCHPCMNYRDETWRQAGRKPPNVHEWDEACEQLSFARGHLDLKESELIVANAEIERLRAVLGQHHINRAQKIVDAVGCCGHKASDHGDDGCLNGWIYAGGSAVIDGCGCMMRGSADR